MITKEIQAQQVLDALGDQTRRDILALLRKAALPVGEIAKCMPISRPAVSRHLRILAQAGLVEHSSSGTRNIFRLRPDGFSVAQAYLECFWDEALACFRRAAEGHTEDEG
jgi:DNA-binding transcriptional ArsR family regulator